jgi:hypothetical protein
MQNYEPYTVQKDAIRCHNTAGLVFKVLAALVGSLLAIFAVAYLIKFCVWLSSKRWDYTIGTVSITLLPCWGDLLVGGVVFLVFGIAVALVHRCYRRVCRRSRRRVDDTDDIPLVPMLHRLNELTDAVYSDGGGGGGPVDRDISDAFRT